MLSTHVSTILYNKFVPHNINLMLFLFNRILFFNNLIIQQLGTNFILHYLDFFSVIITPPICSKLT